MRCEKKCFIQRENEILEKKYAYKYYFTRFQSIFDDIYRNTFCGNINRILFVFGRNGCVLQQETKRTLSNTHQIEQFKALNNFKIMVKK